MNDSPREEQTRLTTAPLVGMLVNAALAAIKIVAGFLGNSYALVADGIESTSDIVSSLVVWGGLRIADRPANERHPYGYGKAEALAGVVTALALLGAAIMIAIQSVHEILTPHQLPHWSTLVILTAVVIIKETMARWVGELGESVDSTSLQADAWHHRSDALTSAAAFVGIAIGLVGGRGYESADDWAALIACGVIAYSGCRLMKLAIRDVLDAAPPKHIEEEIRRIAAADPGVRAVEKCRIRKSGTRYFVELHLEVDGQATVAEGHSIGGRVRATLRESPLRIADALIHIEPHA